MTDGLDPEVFVNLLEREDRSGVSLGARVSRALR